MKKDACAFPELPQHRSAGGAGGLCIHLPGSAAGLPPAPPRYGAGIRCTGAAFRGQAPRGRVSVYTGVYSGRAAVRPYFPGNGPLPADDLRVDDDRLSGRLLLHPLG